MVWQKRELDGWRPAARRGWLVACVAMLLTSSWAPVARGQGHEFKLRILVDSSKRMQEQLENHSVLQHVCNEVAAEVAALLQDPARRQALDGTQIEVALFAAKRAGAYVEEERFSLTVRAGGGVPDLGNLSPKCKPVSIREGGLFARDQVAEITPRELVEVKVRSHAERPHTYIMVFSNSLTKAPLLDPVQEARLLNDGSVIRWALLPTAAAGVNPQVPQKTVTEEFEAFHDYAFEPHFTWSAQPVGDPTVAAGGQVTARVTCTLTNRGRVSLPKTVFGFTAPAAVNLAASQAYVGGLRPGHTTGTEYELTFERPAGKDAKVNVTCGPVPANGVLGPRERVLTFDLGGTTPPPPKVPRLEWSVESRQKTLMMPKDPTAEPVVVTLTARAKNTGTGPLPGVDFVVVTQPESLLTEVKVPPIGELAPGAEARIEITVRFPSVPRAVEKVVLTTRPRDLEVTDQKKFQAFEFQVVHPQPEAPPPDLLEVRWLPREQRTPSLADLRRTPADAQLVVPDVVTVVALSGKPSASLAIKQFDALKFASARLFPAADRRAAADRFDQAAGSYSLLLQLRDPYFAPESGAVSLVVEATGKTLLHPENPDLRSEDATVTVGGLPPQRLHFNALVLEVKDARAVLPLNLADVRHPVAFDVHAVAGIDPVTPRLEVAANPTAAPEVVWPAGVVRLPEEVELRVASPGSALVLADDTPVDNLVFEVRGGAAPPPVPVDRRLPKASFRAGKRRGPAPMRVTFTNMSMNAVRYEWNFGGVRPPSTDVEPGAVEFANPGEHEVKLTAYNGAGDKDVSTMTITVTSGDGAKPPPQEKPTDGFPWGILLLLILVAAVAAAVYFIFFRRPKVAELVYRKGVNYSQPKDLRDGEKVRLSSVFATSLSLEITVHYNKSAQTLRFTCLSSHACGLRLRGGVHQSWQLTAGEPSLELSPGEYDVLGSEDEGIVVRRPGQATE